MTRVTVPFVALVTDEGFPVRVTNEEFPVRVADGLLTALLRAAPAGLYAGWFPPDEAVCLLWPGATGAAREVYRFPAGRGFRTVLAAPEHEPYGAFCVAPGHQIGFNELKAIEVRDFLQAVAGGPAKGPDFREGYEIQRLVELAYRSASEKRWLEV